MKPTSVFGLTGLFKVACVVLCVGLWLVSVTSVFMGGSRCELTHTIIAEIFTVR